MSTTSEITTVRSRFFHLPVIDREVFEVREGLPAEHAVITARCILDALRAMAVSGVQNGIEPDQAYAIHMLVEMVDGLVGSIEGQV